MIKFFRGIRQRLVTENRFSKYLLYAVGEIILVVIGILIALQINNWNHYKADRAKEQVLLRNLEQEFSKNLSQLRSDHAINLSALEAAYNWLETGRSMRDPEKIDSMVGRFIVFATFDPSMGYIDQAINAGKLDLIQSDSLKIFLSQWTGELNDLQEDVFIRRDYWANQMMPTLRKFIPMRNTDSTQDRPDYRRQKAVSKISAPDELYEDFISSLDVDGAIYDHYMNQYFVIINEESIERYIQRILELIRLELDEAKD